MSMDGSPTQRQRGRGQVAELHEAEAMRPTSGPLQRGSGGGVRPAHGGAHYTGMNLQQILGQIMSASMSRSSATSSSSRSGAMVAAAAAARSRSRVVSDEAPLPPATAGPRGISGTLPPAAAGPWVPSGSLPPAAAGPWVPSGSLSIATVAAWSRMLSGHHPPPAP